MNKNQIYMIQGNNYKQMAMELLYNVDLAQDISDKQKLIGIKPNLVLAKKAESGATTHPELVDAVITYLQENDFKNIVVLEGAWVGDLTSQAVRVNGIYDVCQKHNVPFWDLQKDDSIVCKSKSMDIRICKKVKQLDYLINMPVLKGHCQTTITCALKNLKGLIPNSEKRRFHTLGLHKPIAHLNSIIKQDFILVDNICGDLDFEEGGNPVTMNRLLAFKDAVLCDSFAAECMGYKPYDIEYIRIAEELGVGKGDTNKAQIISLNTQEENIKSKKSTRRIEELAKYVEQKQACSACYGSLIYALDRLKDEGYLRKINEKIAIGQGYKGQSGKVGVGQCTSHFNKTIGGCPPKAVDIVEFLKKSYNN